MKKSIIRAFKKAEESIGDDVQLNSHLIIGVDLDDKGFPSEFIIMCNSTAMEGLGMVEMLINNLKDYKKEILKKVDYKENANQQKELIKSVDERIENLPEPLRSKMIGLKDRLDAALESGDTEELMKIKEEMENIKLDFRSSGTDSDTGDFNIEDFKGGL